MFAFHCKCNFLSFLFFLKKKGVTLHYNVTVAILLFNYITTEYY